MQLFHHFMYKTRVINTLIFVSNHETLHHIEVIFHEIEALKFDGKADKHKHL